MKATHLRKNLFRVLDRAARTGRPVEIECKGRKFSMIPLGRPDKLANLQKHPDVHSGDLDDLITIDWMHEWQR